MNALLRAHQRGVRVKIVLNDNWTSPQTLHLRRVLGHNPEHKSFLVFCHGSCRGGPGNLHMKVYAFSRSGAARNVVITGSANMTDRAVSLQWNDLYTMNNETRPLRHVRPGVQPAQAGPGGRHALGELPRTARSGQFYKTGGATGDLRQPGQHADVLGVQVPGPRRRPGAPAAEEDPLPAVPGAGINGHTVIRITMYGWNGARGKWLANQVPTSSGAAATSGPSLSVAGRRGRQDPPPRQGPDEECRLQVHQHRDAGGPGLDGRLLLPPQGPRGQRQHVRQAGAQRLDRLGELVADVVPQRRDHPPDRQRAQHRKYTSWFDYMWTTAHQVRDPSGRQARAAPGRRLDPTAGSAAL